MDKNKSFTFIELLIVMTVIAVFSGLSLAYYNNFNEQAKLKNEAQKLVSVLELAKKKAGTGDLYAVCTNFNGYQVSIQPALYSLNFCCLGACNTTVNNFNLPTNISVYSGTGDIQFLPLFTGTNLSSDFTINLQNTAINSTIKCIKITITKIGSITINDNLTSCT